MNQATELAKVSAKIKAILPRQRDLYKTLLHIKWVNWVFREVSGSF